MDGVRQRSCHSLSQICVWLSRSGLSSTRLPPSHDACPQRHAVFVALCVCDIWMKSSQLLFDHRGPFLDVTATGAVRLGRGSVIYPHSRSLLPPLAFCCNITRMDFLQFCPDPSPVLLPPSLCAVHVLGLKHNSALLMSACSHKAAVGVLSAE